MKGKGQEPMGGKINFLVHGLKISISSLIIFTGEAKFASPVCRKSDRLPY